MSNEIIIAGYHKELEELCIDLGFTSIKIVDPVEPESIHASSSYEGDDDALVNLDLLTSPIVLTPDAPIVRKLLYSKTSVFEPLYVNLISVKAEISKSAILGKGIVIHKMVNVSSSVKLGDFVRLNVGANAMHDTSIGDFATIAPNAVLLGNVTVGTMAYIGSNATILPNVKIGNGAVVGAGAVVTKDVSESSVVVGSPAREISK